MSDEHELFPRAMSLAVHELRTPVTVVNGYLRMLLREQAGPLGDKQRKMLEEADRSCGRIAALVSEMSDLGKLIAGELSMARQRVDLAPLIRELASDMHEGSDRGVKLQLRGTDRPLEVMGDRTRLGTALTVMMRSTLRERGEPGTVILECRELSHPAPGWAVAAVGDEATVARLTGEAPQPPTMLDEWHGGLGLALPIARRVVEAHGGALWSAGGAHPHGGLAVRLPLPA
jgi:signal transduction histidine kinase